MSATPYTETEVLVAHMSGDEPEVDRLLDSMLPGELETFQSQLYSLGRKVFKRARGGS